MLSDSVKSGDQPPAPRVRLEGIVKRFPGVVANDDVTLSFYAGEVHCLLGENGAGKSTLMNILSGVYRPDAGRIFVDGNEVTLSSPRRAIELGIGMVHQHLVLAPGLTVIENLMLGEYDGVRLRRAEALERLEELSGVLDVTLDPDARLGDLALGQQQQTEIIKALWRDSSVLILDEPTSMLTPQGVEELEKVLDRLRERGFVIVFITHKLYEAIRIGDRVSFLRAGKVVGSIEPEVLRSTPAHELQAQIVRAMFGQDARSVESAAELKDDEEEAAPEGRAHRAIRRESSLLELSAVSAEAGPHEVGVTDVSLTLFPGEIVGVAGVDGNGQRALAEVIAGHRPPTEGRLEFDGSSIADWSVERRQRAGIHYVTDDGIGEGVVGQLSVAINTVMKQVGRAPFWIHGRTQNRAIDAKARELIAEYDVRTPSARARAATLSGGNLRKVILARELSFDPRVIIYNKPTYGLDIRTTLMVRDRIRAQAAKDVASLVISTDLDELLDISDRIAVLFQGRITGIVDNVPEDDVRKAVGELMVGIGV